MSKSSYQGPKNDNIIVNKCIYQLYTPFFFNICNPSKKMNVY